MRVLTFLGVVFAFCYHLWWVVLSEFGKSCIFIICFFLGASFWCMFSLWCVIVRECMWEGVRWNSVVVETSEDEVPEICNYFWWMVCPFVRV